jgi:hypothetical protein
VTWTRDELTRALLVKSIAGRTDNTITKGLETGKFKISKKEGKIFIKDIWSKAMIKWVSSRALAW